MAFESTSLESLMAVAALSPEIEMRGGSQHLTPNSYRRLRVGDWLNDRAIPFRIKDAPAMDGRTVYLLENCPFNPEHGNGGEVCIMQSPSGKLSAKCFHKSCAENGWAEFRDAIGRPDPQHYEDVIEAGGSQAEANDFSLKLMHSAEFDAATSE